MQSKFEISIPYVTLCCLIVCFVCLQFVYFSTQIGDRSEATSILENSLNSNSQEIGQENDNSSSTSDGARKQFDLIDDKDSGIAGNNVKQNANATGAIVTPIARSGNIMGSNDHDSEPILLHQDMSNKMNNDIDRSDIIQQDSKNYKLYFGKFEIFNIGLLTIIAALSGIQNGCLPSISSYALLSYSNYVYVLASTITTCITPIAAVTPGYFEVYMVNYKTINVSFIVMLIGVAYLLIIASLSPNPIGKGTVLFEIIVVAVYVVVSGLISFIKTCVIMHIKRELHEVC